MPHQVKLAPSVRLALRQRKAKDGDATSDPVKDRYMLQRANEEIALLSCANLSAGMGKFWASDSDSECDVLGEVELLSSGRRGAPCSGSSYTQKEASFSTVSPPSRHSKPGSSASPPSRQSKPGSQSATSPPVLPPWKKVWRGPLPPRRVSSAKTLGDVILPALAAAGGRTVARVGDDPKISSVQISNAPTLPKRDYRSDLKRNEPRLSHGSGPRLEPTLVRPSRSLVRPILIPDSPPRKTYAAVVAMAGGQGAGRRARGKGAAPGRILQGRGIPGRDHAPPPVGGMGAGHPAGGGAGNQSTPGGLSLIHI